MYRKNYTLSELIEDPGFRRLVKGNATADEISRWDKWIEENEQNRLKAISAISEIAGFEFTDPNLPDLDQKWSELHAKTVGSGKVNKRHKRKSEAKLRWIFLAAAMILVFSIAGFGGFYYYNSDEAVTHLEQLSEEKTIRTAGDEQKSLRFSNDSRIILGGNSTLTYSIGLLNNQAIDVTLEGEAWFDAKGDPSKKQPVFKVNTPDGIIRDIGTEFMVSVQKNQSRVVLQEGQVEVQAIHAENSQNEKVWFSVHKGEMVEFTRSEILKREIVNTTLYTSWATGFIEFAQTELQEFADYVEQRFDVKVEFVNQELKGITLDGAAYFRTLEGLVRSVSEVTSIPVYQSDDRRIVYIGNPNE